LLAAGDVCIAKCKTIKTISVSLRTETPTAPATTLPARPKGRSQKVLLSLLWHWDLPACAIECFAVIRDLCMMAFLSVIDTTVHSKLCVSVRPTDFLICFVMQAPVDPGFSHFFISVGGSGSRVVPREL
jgi:hypothetical protein